MHALAKLKLLIDDLDVFRSSEPLAAGFYLWNFLMDLVSPALVEAKGILFDILLLCELVRFALAFLAALLDHEQGHPVHLMITLELLDRLLRELIDRIAERIAQVFL